MEAVGEWTLRTGGIPYLFVKPSRNTIPRRTSKPLFASSTDGEVMTTMTMWTTTRLFRLVHRRLPTKRLNRKMPVVRFTLWIPRVMMLVITEASVAATRAPPIYSRAVRVEADLETLLATGRMILCQRRRYRSQLWYGMTRTRFIFLACPCL
jgi:hypothetical protein